MLGLRKGKVRVTVRARVRVRVTVRVTAKARVRVSYIKLKGFGWFWLGFWFLRSLAALGWGFFGLVRFWFIGGFRVLLGLLMNEKLCV